MVEELVVELEQTSAWVFAWLVVGFEYVEVPEVVRMACTAGTACFASTVVETNLKPATGASTRRMSTSSAVVDDAVAG